MGGGFFRVSLAIFKVKLTLRSPLEFVLFQRFLAFVPRPEKLSNHALVNDKIKNDRQREQSR